MSKPFIAILTATKTEKEAFNQYIENHFADRSRGVGKNSIINFDKVMVVHHNMDGEKGNLHSLCASLEILNTYHPICLIGCGICAGVPNKRDNTKEYDLFLGSRVFYYEPMKISPGGAKDWRPFFYASTINNTLLRKFKIDQNNLQLFREDRIPKPAVKSVLYASGEIVVNDPAFVDSLIVKAAKKYGEFAQAIDMEAAGIAKACAGTGTKFLIAKCVSDFGQDKEDTWQHRACEVSFGSTLNWCNKLTAKEIESLIKPVILKEDMPKNNYTKAKLAVNLVGGILPPRGIPKDEITTKRNRHDILTKYDIIAENFIREILHAELAPDTCIWWGEESVPSCTLEELKKGPSLVVDPVDGTLNLKYGRPEVAISIAYRNNFRTEWGVIRLPYRKLSIGMTQGRLEVNDIPWTIKRNPDHRLIDAVVSLPGDLEKLKKTNIQNIFQCLIPNIGIVRISGALAYDLACMALGELDARISTQVKPVDIAAGILFVEGMGGIVTQIDGSPIDLDSKTLLAARNADLHAEIIMILKENNLI